MTNYICINGNKTELTEEQLKQLGIELPKVSPFARANKGDKYWFIMSVGEVGCHRDINDHADKACFNIANYCTDRAIMEQRALHETLNRLLWRYSMEHDGDKIEWGEESYFKIVYDHNDNKYCINVNDCYESTGTVYFYDHTTASNAIEEIIKPFMEDHPNFKF